MLVENGIIIGNHLLHFIFRYNNLQWDQHISQNNIKKCLIVIPCVKFYNKYVAIPIFRGMVAVENNCS